jgi:hypothetical protein
MKFNFAFDSPVPVRDGSELSTSVWRPDTDEPVPVLLMRTPYSKEKMGQLAVTSPNLFAMMRSGYAVVIQECRGTFGSDGVFVPHLQDGPSDRAAQDAWLPVKVVPHLPVGVSGSGWTWETAHADYHPVRPCARIAAEVRSLVRRADSPRAAPLGSTPARTPLRTP